MELRKAFQKGDESDIVMYRFHLRPRGVFSTYRMIVVIGLFFFIWLSYGDKGGNVGRNVEEKKLVKMKDRGTK